MRDDGRHVRRGQYMSPMEVMLRSMVPDGAFFPGERDITPPVDVSETTDCIEVRTELPGMKREEIQIDVANGVLTISGEKKEETGDNGRSWHRREVRYGFFSRSFSLPTGVKPDEAKASLEDGVLSVILPKEEKALHRKIQIEG